MKNLPPDLTALVAQASAVAASHEAALTAYHCLDLTSLNDTDNLASIDALMAKAYGHGHGHVAALCVYPQFLTRILNEAAAAGINRATVINFPHGKGTPEQTAADIRHAIRDGANEIDIVLDHEAFLSGDDPHVSDILRAARRAADNVKLKVILESAVFEDYRDLRSAGMLALTCGADFLKTSTGKHKAGGASPEAVGTLLQVIRSMNMPAGVKVSGGVKTVADAARYIALTESIMGRDWIGPDTFRIGASGIVADIVATLNPGAGATAAPNPSVY